MKRRIEEDMGSPAQKRARAFRFELRILIPSYIAGSVIGKGANKITKLRSATNAAIQVLDCPGPERLISIFSHERNDELEMLEQLMPSLMEDPSSGNVQVRLLLHHAVVGRIIGRGGTRVKELRRTTAAEIRVYERCCPGSTDRVVAVSGNVDVVLGAVEQILLIVDEVEVRITDVIIPYDPRNFDETLAVLYGGFREPHYDDGDGGYAQRKQAPSRGGFHDGGAGGRMMERPPPRRGGNGNVRRHDDYDYEHGGPVFQAERGVDDEKGRERGPPRTTQVTIPKVHAGAIIGVGGSRIRGIMADSGARIWIDKALPGSDERIITVSGSDRQIHAGLYLLQQTVKNHTYLINFVLDDTKRFLCF